MMKRALGQKKFFLPIFGTFGRYVTNLRGTFVENIKKPKSTHPSEHDVPCDLLLLIVYCIVPIWKAVCQVDSVPLVWKGECEGQRVGIGLILIIL
jgi:hypothetical protein